MICGAEKTDWTANNPEYVPVFEGRLNNLKEEATVIIGIGEVTVHNCQKLLDLKVVTGIP